ncbi:MAG TPA: Uma2 family endonuclease, partial [Thermomicrobiales bacterium]
HEYVAGKVFAMVGGSPTDSEIAPNVITALGPQLRKRGCKVYTSDLRVAIPHLDIYTYPDVTVVCGERQFDGKDGGLLNPTVLIEVLSPATERYDRGMKFGRYQRLASLREYVLIAQAYPFIERLSRLENDLWSRDFADDLGTAIALPSIDCALSLADVYAEVTFDEANGNPVG